MEERLAEMGFLEDSLVLLLEIQKKKQMMWKQELKGLPKGTLHLLPRGKKTYYQHAVGRCRRGISQDEDLIYALARKRYLQVLLEEQEEVLRYMHDVSDPRYKPKTVKGRKHSKVEKLLERYGNAGLKVLRITCSEKQYRWAMAQYRKNTKRQEELKFETYSGIKVRSKSEQSIGNEMELKGVPFRYEMELRVKVDWMEGIIGMAAGGYKYYYPDFVILTATGEYIVWEHLGRVDLERYRVHNMEKIAAYRQNGVCDDEHLILTFEKDHVKQETIKQLISKRILPYL